MSSRTTSRATVSRVSPTSDGDVIPHLGNVAGEVEVPPAVVGHGLEQCLVEVRADPERAGGHAPAAQVVGAPRQLVGIADPVIGETVREQQDAVDARGCEAGGHLLAAREPARVQVRAAARHDRAQAPGRLGTGLRRGHGAGHDHVHLGVVGHDGEAVVGLEAVDRLERGLLGEGELVVAAHRSGAIQDEGEVDRLAVPRRIRRHGGRGDVDEQEALAAAPGADEAAVGADDEARIDQAVGVGGLGHDGPPSRWMVKARMGRVWAGRSR